MVCWIVVNTTIFFWPYEDYAYIARCEKLMTYLEDNVDQEWKSHVVDFRFIAMLNSLASYVFIRFHSKSVISVFKHISYYCDAQV